MSFADPLSSDFWKSYTGEAAEWSVVRRGLESHRWDVIADSYQDFVRSTSYGETVKRVVSILKAKGVLEPDKTVLDVASGPGTFALLMAPMVSRVTCIDISPAMIKELEAELKKRRLTNVRSICQDWFTYESEEDFDLVFCGMSPILDDLRALDLMLKRSRRYLALLYWAGPYENDLFLRLYREATGEELRWFSANAVALFNYLYGLGYLPEISFFKQTWELELPVEEEVSYLLWCLSFYKEPSPLDAQIAHRLVQERASEKGLIKDVTRTKLAFIFLDKKAD